MLQGPDMATTPKRRATYQDVVDAPEHLVAELLVPEGWLLVATHAGDELVRAEPFAAVEIDLLALWGETRPAP